MSMFLFGGDVRTSSFELLPPSSHCFSGTRTGATGSPTVLWMRRAVVGHVLILGAEGCCQRWGWVSIISSKADFPRGFLASVFRLGVIWRRGFFFATLESLYFAVRSPWCHFATAGWCNQLALAGLHLNSQESAIDPKNPLLWPETHLPVCASGWWKSKANPDQSDSVTVCKWSQGCGHCFSSSPWWSLRFFVFFYYPLRGKSSILIILLVAQAGGAGTVCQPPRPLDSTNLLFLSHTIIEINFCISIEYSRFLITSNMLYFYGCQTQRFGYHATSWALNIFYFKSSVSQNIFMLCLIRRWFNVDQGHSFVFLAPKGLILSLQLMSDVNHCLVQK